MEAVATHLLTIVPLFCIALSLVFFAAVAATRRRVFSTCAHTFFTLALAWTALSAWSKGSHSLSFFFALFSGIWLYLTVTGKVIGSTLR